MEENLHFDQKRGKTRLFKILSMAFLTIVMALGVGCTSSVSMMPKDSYQTLSKSGDAYNPKFERLLTKDVQFLDVTFAAGSRLIQGDGAWWMTTSKPVTIEGIEFPAGSQISFTDKVSQVFYIAFFQYKVTKSAKLKLLGAQVGADFTIGKLKFNKGSTVWFKRDRDVVGFLKVKTGPIRVESARIKGDHTFAGTKYSDASDVWFNRVGEVKNSRTKVARIAEKEAWQRRVQACRQQCAPWGNDLYEFQNCRDRCLGR